MILKHMVEYTRGLYKNLVIGELLYKYHKEGKKEQFKNLASTMGNDYAYAYSLVLDRKDNPSDYTNGLNSPYFVELAKYSSMERVIAKFLLLILTTNGGRLNLFHELLSKYKSSLTGSDYGEIIIRLYHTEHVEIAEKLIDEHIDIIPADDIAKVAMWELSRNPVNIQRVGRLLEMCKKDVSLELKAQLAFRLMLGKADVNKYSESLLSNEVVDAMLPAVISDMGILPNDLVSQIYQRAGQHQIRLLANMLQYANINMINFLRDEEKITTLISNIPSNDQDSVLKQIIDNNLLIPRLGEVDLHNFIFSANEVITLVEHLLELCNKQLKKEDRDDFYNILFCPFFMHLCALDRIVDEELLLEIFESAEKKYNNHTLGYLAKIVNHQLTIYYKASGEYELTETGRILFSKTGYYMAKNLEGTSITALKTIWPKQDANYGIYENCDLRSYLAINYAFEQNDTQTVENILNIFDAQHSTSIIAGFLAHRVQYEGQFEFDHIFSFLKKMPASLQEKNWKKIFEVVNLKEINDTKINLLEKFFDDNAIADRVKSYVYELIAHDKGLVRKVFHCSYVTNKLAEIIADTDNKKHKATLGWINDANEQDLDNFAASHISGACKVQNLRPVLFAHYLDKADEKIIPKKVREYLDANSRDVVIPVANKLISLNAGKALECLINSNKIVIDPLEQASLLMKSIEAGGMDAINVMSKFIAKTHNFKNNYDIWEMLAFLFRLITFSLPNKQEQVARQFAKLYIGQDQSIITFAHISEVVKNKELEDPQAILDMLTYATVYCHMKKDSKSIKGFSDICGLIIEKHPSLNLNATFKKIGYSNLSSVMAKKEYALNEHFKVRVTEFIKEDRKQMNWVERVLHTKPQAIQIT